MKKLYAILMVASVCGLSFNALYAADTKTKKAEKAEKITTVTNKETKVIGTIATVDTAQSTITVKAKNTEETFKIDVKTVIEGKGKKITISDIKAGQKVRVVAQEGVALKINIV